MADPYKGLASILDARMSGIASTAISGQSCELGTMTGSGLVLDGFKHEIQDYLVADWTFKMELPQASRVVKIASPVNSDGSDQDGTTKYSELSRIDFNVQGVDSKDITVKVHMDLKAEIKQGDRVLVVPINGGRDHVIISRVVG